MDISLFASAARPKLWKKLYCSLIDNECEWEIVFVGPNPPIRDLPHNFRYYKCDFKPTQCYAAASHLCQGRLIGYMADDAIYGENALDQIVDAGTRLGKKVILTQKTIENGKDVSEEHHFFRHCKDTPVMAPMAFMNKDWFFELGGYDRNFVSGQAENDIVMRAFADGGKVINVPKSIVNLNHEEAHGGIVNKIKYKLGKNSFRTGYSNDRRYLEECWLKEGYGTYDENTLKHGTVSPVRLLPHQGFNYENILTVSQGNQGRWECPT